MKMQVSKTILLAACVTIVILGIGCQEEELSSDKTSRVIAAENIRLKKEVKKRDEMIERLEKQHEQKLQRQEELLAKYAKQKEVLEKQLQQGVENQIDDVLANVIEENAKLRDEIKKLAAELEKLTKGEENIKF
ncbi:MAG: hypothetical protein A2173_00070 [Planctomycetes bacterium RBG_13_44_8b]|nr:MAG: hypothetical protein A2173_00070 [Planctomycetes bacterium RBG_13_44_8b]